MTAMKFGLCFIYIFIWVKFDVGHHGVALNTH